MTQIQPSASLFEIFGEPVHVYTRAQAIDDGVLVNLSDPESDTAPVCRQHYKYPIACTLGVFELMRRAVENSRYCNDYAGLLQTCSGCRGLPAGSWMLPAWFSGWPLPAPAVPSITSSSWLSVPATRASLSSL